MKKEAWLILLVLVCAGCINSPKNTLPGRWNFEAVRMPNIAGLLDSVKEDNEQPPETMRHFFLDYKLILRKDHTYDMVFLKKYTHGKWSFDEDLRTLSLLDESAHSYPLRLQVDTVTSSSLELKMGKDVLSRLVPDYIHGMEGTSFFRQKGTFIFYLSADKESYDHPNEDPYSKENNMWRIRPAKPENDEELAARLVNHMQFCRLIMQDAVDRDKDYVSFNWLRTPLVISKHDITLRDYAKVRDAWDENFYDTLQAQKGYKLLKDCLADDYTAEEVDNRFKIGVILFDKAIDNLKHPIR